MSEDLRRDHVKLESPSILTKKIFFCPAIGQRRSQEFYCEPNFGGRGPPPPLPWLRQWVQIVFFLVEIHVNGINSTVYCLVAVTYQILKLKLTNV